MVNSRQILVASAMVLASWPYAAIGQLTMRSEANPFGPPVAAAPVLPTIAEGYCVVTLHDQQQWQLGERAIGAQLDGRQYFFAGEREREIFAAAATVYAPVLSGDCVVTYAETGQRLPGRAQFGVALGGRLYFFASEEARTKFVAAPTRYVDADLADGGRCLVSRVEYRRDVAGMPETAVLAGGLRRLFAGAHEQKLYLQQPERYNGASATPGAAPMATALIDGGGEWRAATPELADSKDSRTSTADATPVSGQRANGEGGQEILLKSEPAMGGYCPVTIRQKGLWVRGRYDDHVEVENLVFFTAGSLEREAFNADATPFIPALGGDCVVSLVDRGEKMRGSVFHASTYQDRLYLFADAECKATFDAGPARYATIDLAASGACVVTLAEERRTQPGFAEFSVWHAGLFYRFAGKEQKAKFNEAPDKYVVAANAPSATLAPAPAPPVPPAPRAASTPSPADSGQ